MWRHEVARLRVRAVGVGGAERWVAYPVILWLMGFGGYGLVLCWYVSGSMSDPRRYLYPLSGTEVWAWIGAGCAVIALTGAVMVCRDLIEVFLASPHLNLPELAPRQA